MRAAACERVTVSVGRKTVIKILPDEPKAARILALKIASPGDLILFLGAGDISLLSDQFVQKGSFLTVEGFF